MLALVLGSLVKTRLLALRFMIYDTFELVVLDAVEAMIPSTGMVRACLSNKIP